MSAQGIVTGVVLEEACLTLEQVASVLAVEPDWVVIHVSEGHFPAIAGEPAEWRFSSRHLRRALRMRRVERDYEAVPELAALVADMLDEIDALRSRVR